MPAKKKTTKKPARRPTLASLVEYLRTIPYWEVREDTRVMREDIRTAAGWWDKNNS
jgi:hypothetical protein